MGRQKQTIGRCAKEALKYQTRSDFRQNSYYIYNMACSFHWLDEICTHMIRTGSIMYRCVYVYEFPDNYAYVGLTNNITKRNSKRKSKLNDAVTKYIKETNLEPNLKQLCDYVHIDVARELEKDLIKIYKSMGWNMLNITDGGEVGAIERKWTKEECHKEALSFKTKTKFKEKKCSAYMCAKRNNWLDDICMHMIQINTHRTSEDCRLIALKYKTKVEFEKYDKASYAWAKRNEILEELCAHMSRKYKPQGYWTKERCQEKALEFDSRYKFTIGASGAHDAANRNGWIDEICVHMKRK